MLNFTTEPPDDLGRSGYRLIRTPAARPITGYVLSDNVTGCPTHFINNRTVPCEAPDCDACASGVGWRWHGYLLVLLADTQETVLFEMTAAASQPFKTYRERYGTTRGAAFKATRANSRPNGRVLIQTKPADLAKITLPKAQPVHKLLCHIWNIPETQIDTTDHRARAPFQNATIDRSKAPVVPFEPPDGQAQVINFTAAIPAGKRNGNHKP